MENIKAIETVYNGYRFRSRLEAKWAVFFDEIGIEYQYEPEGFVGLDNIPYLPDFYFPAYNVYAEVKGTDSALKNDAQKIAAAIDFQATPVSNGLIILGDIPNPNNIGFANVPMFNYLYWNKGIQIEYAIFTGLYPALILGNSSIVNRMHSFEKDYFDYYSGGELPEIISTRCKWTNEDCMSSRFAELKQAYTKARQARFEHNEKKY